MTKKNEALMREPRWFHGSVQTLLFYLTPDGDYDFDDSRERDDVRHDASYCLAGAIRLHLAMQRHDRLEDRADEVRDLLPLDPAEFAYLVERCAEVDWDDYDPHSEFAEGQVYDVPGLEERFEAWRSTEVEGSEMHHGRAKALLDLSTWALEVAWSPPIPPPPPSGESV
jgi:hypothetical protein